MVERVTGTLELGVQEQGATASQAAGGGSQGMQAPGIQWDKGAFISRLIDGFTEAGGVYKAFAKQQGALDASFGAADSQNRANWFSRGAYEQGVAAVELQQGIQTINAKAHAAMKEAAAAGITPDQFNQDTKDQLQQSLTQYNGRASNADLAHAVDTGMQMVTTAGTTYAKVYTAHLKTQAEQTADSLAGAAVRSAKAFEGNPENVGAVFAAAIQQIKEVPNLDVLSPDYHGKAVAGVMKMISQNLDVSSAPGVATVNELYKRVLTDPVIKDMPIQHQQVILNDAKAMVDEAGKQVVAMTVTKLSTDAASISRGNPFDTGDLNWLKSVTDVMNLPNLSNADRGRISAAVDSVYDAEFRRQKEAEKENGKMVTDVSMPREASDLTKQVIKEARAAGADELEAQAIAAFVITKRANQDSNPHLWKQARELNGYMLDSVAQRGGDTNFAPDKQGNPSLPKAVQDWWGMLKQEYGKQRAGEPNNFYTMTSDRPEYQVALDKALSDSSASTTNQQIVQFNRTVFQGTNKEFIARALPPENVTAAMQTAPKDTMGMLDRMYQSGRRMAVNTVDFTRWFNDRKGDYERKLDLAQAFVEPNIQEAKLEYLRSNYPSLQYSNAEQTVAQVQSGISAQQIQTGSVLASVMPKNVAGAVPGFAKLSPEHQGAVIDLYVKDWNDKHPNDSLLAVRPVWNGNSIALQALPKSAENTQGAVNIGLITSESVAAYNKKFFETNSRMMQSDEYQNSVLVSPQQRVTVGGKNGFGIPGGYYTGMATAGVQMKADMNGAKWNDADANYYQHGELPASISHGVLPGARDLGIALSWDKGAPAGLRKLPPEDERRISILLTATASAAGPRGVQSLVALANKVNQDPTQHTGAKLQQEVRSIFPAKITDAKLQQYVYPYMVLLLTGQHTQP